MKKIFSLIAVLGLLISSSCDDAIDIKQEGELTEQALFETSDDLQDFLVGNVYSFVSVDNEIGFTANFTDEIGIGPGNGGQGTELFRYILTPAEGYASSLWLGKYSLINRVNRLIRGATLITVADEADQQRVNSIIAEARALRAFAYMQLLAFYSPDMTDPDALGVMLLDFVPEVDTKLPRVRNAEIFALIEADLAYAQANLVLPDPVPANQYKYVTQDFINATYARFYLYSGNHTLAKQYAQQAIDQSGLTLTPATPYNAANFYTAGTTNPYRRMWADAAAPAGRGEILFALSRPTVGGGGSIGGTFFFNTTEITGGAFFNMGLNLFNELNENAGDIRRLAFVDPTSTAEDKIIDKYPGKTNAPLRNDIKVYRISEMFLILAECAVVENQLATAAGYIKNIRDARSRTGAVALPVYADAQAAWADIVDERRKELCFEGHRYIDLKRLGVLANRAIDRNPSDDILAATPLTLPTTDYRFTLPIPQTEIQGNPNIRSQQNPGYN
ncbi:RagB/SusD family nutrient uptake outer membrane protein [Flavobacterium sp.]|uniref:RagB/SusD family nutrient uptake outer membrane protein n=1 Tax=Flavobacterium sp. TaxID=239 RepID=UPI003B997CA3